MEASGFPPRLDLFKAVAARLVSDDGGPPLGITWLRKFLNCHPEYFTKFASGLNRQRALSSKPEPIKDYFRKLQTLLRKYKFLPHNIYNTDEKGCLIEQKPLLGGGDGSQLERHRMDHESGLKLSKPAAPTAPCFH